MKRYPVCTILFLLAFLFVGCETLSTNSKTQFWPLSKKKFSARKQMAELSNDTEMTLMKKGYVPLGTIQAEHITKRCWGVGNEEKCSTIEHKTDLTTDILKEAATKGGDIVTLKEKNERSFRVIYKSKGSYDTEVGGEVYFKSWGTIWRYQPDLSIGESLVKAAGDGDLDFVGEIVLSQPGSVDALNSGSDSALIAASKEGRIEVVKFLLSNRANPNLVNKFRSPLERAALNGHVEIVRLLIGKGADVNFTDYNNGTVLHSAVFGKSADIVKLLLDAGARVNVRMKDTTIESVKTPLDFARMYKYSDIVKLLQDAGGY